MMLIQESPPRTPEAFEAWAFQPEHTDQQFEWIHGEVIQKMPTHGRSSQAAMKLGALLTLYAMQHNVEAHITGADGGYGVGENLYVPDVGFLRKERLPELPATGFIPIAPDIAIEVVSPSDSMRELRLKITDYLAVGTVVWVVDMDAQLIEIHAPQRSARVLQKGDVLEGGEALPNFSLPLTTLFGES